MISDAEVAIQRCQNVLCRHVMILILGAQRVVDVLETGSESCEHTYDPDRVVTVRRDVLVIHALWTVGRLIAQQGVDHRAHILAESLGYLPGDAVPVTDIPLLLVDPVTYQLTWQGVCAAARVAAEVRDLPYMGWNHVSRWMRLADYLGRWQHHVM